jgi:hypothetical protein
MTLQVLRAAAFACLGHARAELGDELPHAVLVGFKRGAALVDQRLDFVNNRLSGASAGCGRYCA